MRQGYLHSRVAFLLSLLWFAYLFSIGTSISLMELFSSLLFVSVLVIKRHEILTKQFWLSPPFSVPLLLFIAVACFGTLVSGASWKEKIYDLQRMRFFILYLFLYYALLEAKLSRFFWIQPVLVVGLIISVYGFFQHFIGVDWIRPDGRKVILYAVNDSHVGPLVIGTFNHHLTFANVYLFFATLLTVTGAMLKGRFRYLLPVGLLLFLMILWTQSRMAWLTVGILFLLATSLIERRVIAKVMFGLVVLFFTLFMFDPGFHGRFEGTFLKPSVEYSPNDRVKLWAANWDLFKSSPVWGVGYNNNERRSAETLDRLFPEAMGKNFSGHAHSNFFQILSSTGLLGLVFYLWFWFLVMERCWRVYQSAVDEQDRVIGFALFIAFIGFHLQGLTQWNFGDAEVLHCVIFCLALLAQLPLSAQASVHSSETLRVRKKTITFRKQIRYN